MIPTAKKGYTDKLGTDGELRVGWASWDEGAFEKRSIKWAYKGRDGRVARTSPELPVDVLVEMALFAYEQRELSPEQVERLRTAFLRLETRRAR